MIVVQVINLWWIGLGIVSGFALGVGVAIYAGSRAAGWAIMRGLNW